MNDATKTMTGKICLITGGTAGIGLATATELARLGGVVTIVGRNRERAQAAVDRIKRETRNEAVDFLCADLAVQKEVRQLAADFLARHKHLDVLVNNAGAMFAVRQETVEGIEMTLALNHLGPFLLTNLLLDALKASQQGRIVNVASAAYEDVDSLDFDDLQAAKKSGIGAYPRSELGSAFYSLVLPWAHPAFLQYARTKLANMLFTIELAKRLAGTTVTANALHPGLVDSGFSGGNGLYGWFMRRYMRLRGISVAEGAEASIYLAASPDVANVTGLYFIKNAPVKPAPCALDAAAASRLWQVSAAMTKME